MVTNYDTTLNLHARRHALPDQDHVGYNLDLDAIFNEAARQPFVEHYIPGRHLNDVLLPNLLGLVAANGNQLMPGITYDPTSAPTMEIDASGKETFLIGGEHVARPILRIKGIRVDVDTTAFDPTVYPDFLRKLAPHIKFKGPVTLEELDIVNDPITGIMFVPKLPQVDAVHANIKRHGNVTSQIMAEILPGLLNPQLRFQQFCQEQLDLSTRNAVPAALPDKKIRKASLLIKGDPGNKPELCGLKFRLETKPAI